MFVLFLGIYFDNVCAALLLTVQWRWMETDQKKHQKCTYFKSYGARFDINDIKHNWFLLRLMIVHQWCLTWYYEHMQIQKKNLKALIKGIIFSTKRCTFHHLLASEDFECTSHMDYFYDAFFFFWDLQSPRPLTLENSSIDIQQNIFFVFQRSNKIIQNDIEMSKQWQIYHFLGKLFL